MVAGGSGGLGGRFEVEEAGRLGQLEVAQDLFLAGGEFGALAADAGRAGEGAEVEPFELVAEVAPGFAGGVLGDADEEQGEPAEQDVGADPVFLAVVDGAQLEARLQVAPGALDLEQLLVAERDVLGGEGRVGGAQEKLAVEALLGSDGGPVDPKQPCLRLAEVAAVAGLGLEPAGEIVPAGRG